MKTFIQKFFEKTSTNKKTYIPAPPKEEWPESWITIHYKNYPRFPKIKLPRFKPAGEFERLLASRRSFRNFNGLKIDKLKFMRILFFSSYLSQIESEDFMGRAYPSGGGRYPLELYVFVKKIENLKKGIYHYSLETNSLEVLQSDDFEKLLKESVADEMIQQTAALIIITAIPSRSSIKYNDKALRYIFIEVGHLAQNILLLTEKYKIKACPVGGFFDDKMNIALRIDKTSERTVYSIAIG